MKKELKRTTLLVLVAVLILSLFSGCSYSVSVTSEGISVQRKMQDDELIRMDDLTITVPEAMIFLISEKKQMESVYGTEIWSQTAGDQTVGTYMDGELEAFLIEMAKVGTMASEMGITLNQTEQDRITQAAKDYYRGLTEADRAYTGITQEACQSAFTHYYTFQKVVTYIQNEMNLEISDDEARVITVQQIYVKNYDDAETVMSRVQNGRSFEALGAAYNEADDFEITITRGEKSETYENAVFSLSNGEVSAIFHDDDGYYIVKCISNYNVEMTMANKKTIADQLVSEEFKAEFTKYVGNLSAEENPDAWQSVTFNADYSPTGASFYSVYETYF